MKLPAALALAALPLVFANPAAAQVAPQPALCAVGTAVEVLNEGVWLPGVVTEGLYENSGCWADVTDRTGRRINVWAPLEKLRSSAGAVTAPAFPAGSPAALCAVGTTVEVRRDGRWHTGVVTQGLYEGSGCFVTVITAAGAKTEQWTTLADIRAPGSGPGPVGPAPQPAPAPLPAVEIDTTPQAVQSAFDRNIVQARRDYHGKTIRITGTLTRIGTDSVSVEEPPFGKTRCIFEPGNEDQIAPLVPDSTITVVGSNASWGLGWLHLDRCRVEAVGPVKAADTPDPAGAHPEDPPFGTYAVYQWNGTANAYQYRLTLADGGRYRVNDGAWGRYAYDPGRKQLTFMDGKLRGFGGLYYTQGRNADGPTIALSVEGPVGDLETAGLGAYQYARHRPE